MLNPSSERVAASPGATEASAEGDAELVAAARRGEETAYFRIWSKYAAFVSRLVRAYFGPGAERDDLAQEVFLRVFSRINEVRNPDALRGFIAGICLGVARNMSRRARIRAMLSLSPRDEDQDIEVPGIGEEARQVLRHLSRLLAGASAGDRSLFVARYVEKMEMKDIALAHKISAATARRRVARMTARFEAAMARDPVLVDCAAKLFRKGG